MKFSTSRIFALLAALLCAAPVADVLALPPNVEMVQLAGITNDRDTSVSYLNLVLNQSNGVRGIYVQTRVPGGRDAGHDSGRGIKDGAFSLKKIESRKGVVLGQGQGVKAILLRGNIDSQAGTGSLVIKYLTNGLLMSYSQCKIGLRRAGHRKWELVNAYNGRQIHNIKVKTWWLGISTLQNVCPGSASDIHA